MFPIAILGTLGGALTRLAPEVMKFMDRKGDRAHELAMLDKQYALDKLHAEQGVLLAQAQGAATVGASDAQAFLEAIKGQSAVRTGIGWVDAATALVRPILTYWWAVLFYTGAKIAAFVALLHAGHPALASIALLWGPAEEGIAGSIIGFWFADRSLRKGGGVSAPH